jgi:hypothetical protein
MAGLKRIVGVTLAVVLVAALVVFVLRPSANTTTSTAPQPGAPTDQPTPGVCSDLSRGHQQGECGTWNGTGQGSDNDTDDHNANDDHSDSHDGNDGSDGDHDANDQDGHGDHSDRDYGGVEADD